MKGYTQISITLNNREVKLPDVLSGKYIAANSFEEETLSFIREWITGTASFTLQTSGSTGEPKSITLSRDQIKQSAQRTIVALGLTEKDVSLVCLDPKYIAGKMMLVRALESNMKIVACNPAANPFETLSTETKVSFSAFVPLQINEMLLHAEAIASLNKLNVVIIGGGLVDSNLRAKLTTLSPAIFATYGMTETISHVALQRLNGTNAAQHFTVLPGINIDLDSRGCLVIEMPEFPEKIVTNDLIQIISPTEFQWVGRYDNVINSGGFKISPEKIERVLETILPQRSFFVAGIPDDRLGEKLVLIIEGNQDDVNLIGLGVHPYEIPKEIIYLPKFVRTETGKINRRKTVRLLAAG